MQSKTTRGVRRLLVSTGVISLVLSVAAPAALAGTHEDDGARKVWVCHATSSTTNPVELNLVSINAVAHGDEIVTGAQADLLAGFENKAQVNALPEPEFRELVATVCVGRGGDPVGTPGDEHGHVPDGGTPGNSDGTPGGGNDNTPAGPDGGTPGNSDGTPGGGNDNTPAGPDSQENPASVGGDSTEDTDEDNSPAPPAEPVIVISADSVTRPTPAVPAVPAQPTVPAVPAQPAAPAVPTQPAAPASPVAAGSATPSSNEVLGSVTARTPSGATVTALAATGTSTTTVLAVLGTVLLVAGLGLQVSARRRVRSADVGA